MDNAALYASSNGLQKRDALVILNEFVAQMSWEEREKVLDVGCGSGDVTRNILLPVLPRIDLLVGVDKSPEMVDYASKHSSHNLLQFLVYDIVHEPPSSLRFHNSFSKIFSFYCLHWIKDMDSCLWNMFRLLKPGGEVLLVFLAKNPLFTVYEIMSRKEEWKAYMLDVSNFIPRYHYLNDAAEVFAESAEKVGFSVTTCEAPEFSYIFTNMNTLKDAVKAVNPFYKRIPKERRDDFLMECLEELLSVKASGAKDRIATYNLMIAHLQKSA